MAKYFDKSQTDMTWAINAYTLAFGGLLLLGGRAGDILGRRRMFIIGLGLFTLGSLLGGHGDDLPDAARRAGHSGHRRRHRLADRAVADQQPRSPRAGSELAPSRCTRRCRALVPPWDCCSAAS